MDNKVAIVTGGTGALGRAVVEKFSDEGVKVYVPSLSIEEFNNVFDSSLKSDADFKLRKIFSFVCNATDESSVSEFVENVAAQEGGRIDFLVNTVGGISHPTNVVDTTSDELEKMLSLNFRSAFYFTREALKVMKNLNFGRIVSIGAMAGLEPEAGRFSYGLSKSAVINLMETVSKEMKSSNIRCNTIIPSIIDTPANREWGSPEEIKKWVKTGEIAGIIWDLVQNEFSSVRSTCIKVYGSV